MKNYDHQPSYQDPRQAWPFITGMGMGGYRMFIQLRFAPPQSHPAPKAFSLLESPIDSEGSPRTTHQLTKCLRSGNNIPYIQTVRDYSVIRNLIRLSLLEEILELSKGQDTQFVGCFRRAFRRRVGRWRYSRDACRYPTIPQSLLIFDCFFDGQ